MLKLGDEVEDALYLLSPIANVVRKLGERVQYQIGEVTSVDHQSGFRLVVNSYGRQQWEMRAYRFNPPPIDIEALIINLEKHLEGRLVPVEEDADKSGWPLWQRAFLPYAYLELKFYTPGRFAVSITGSREVSIGYLQSAILAAVSSAQEEGSRAEI